MRIVKEIPNPLFKITVFSWNLKYIIKIEYGQYEQVFKIREENLFGIDELEKMLDDTFMEQVASNFRQMDSAFSAAWSALQKSKTGLA